MNIKKIRFQQVKNHLMHSIQNWVTMPSAVIGGKLLKIKSFNSSEPTAVESSWGRFFFWIENVKLIYAFGDIVLQTRFDNIINATISNKLNVSECDDKKINPQQKKRVDEGWVRLWGRSIMKHNAIKC